MARGASFGQRGRGRGYSRSNTSFRGGRGRGRGRGGANVLPSDAQPKRDEDGTLLAERFEKVQLSDEIDEKLGFARMTEGKKDGWLINMHPVSQYTRLTSPLYLLYILCERHWSRMQTGQVARQPSIFISFKMMEECSSARISMSLTFTLHAKCVSHLEIQNYLALTRQQDGNGDDH